MVSNREKFGKSISNGPSARIRFSNYFSLARRHAIPLETNRSSRVQSLLPTAETCYFDRTNPRLWQRAKVSQTVPAPRVSNTFLSTWTLWMWQPPVSLLPTQSLLTPPVTIVSRSILGIANYIIHVAYGQWLSKDLYILDMY